MADKSPIGVHASSAVELKQRLEAERNGLAFLVLRDADGHQHLHPLGATDRRVTIGRHGAADVGLPWDASVSAIHAELEPIGNGWGIVDGGLSRNGTFVNGKRLQDRYRLSDGDTLRFGKTLAVYRFPQVTTDESTALASTPVEAGNISPAQRRVLVALCRPLKQADGYVSPASNRQIADELFLGIDGVKTQMKALFATFSVEDLPQNQKRARLAQLAFESGVVSERDL
jgi:pSer/pThr/pTyr-binding forkhead associated (FHA) protein